MFKIELVRFQNMPDINSKYKNMWMEEFNCIDELDYYHFTSYSFDTAKLISGKRKSVFALIVIFGWLF